MTQVTTPPQITPLRRLAMRFQSFLLRRNWMGRMGEFIMVITVRGRKTGRAYSTPIGYLRDGDDLISFTPGGAANWFKNARANGTVTLNIKGQAINAQTHHITDSAEKDRIFEMYRQQVRAQFKRLFGVEADAAEADLAAAKASREFIRFTPVA